MRKVLSRESVIIISGTLLKTVIKNVKKTMSTSDKIDSIVTNRFLALPIFCGSHVPLYIMYR